MCRVNFPQASAFIFLPTHLFPFLQFILTPPWRPAQFPTIPLNPPTHLLSVDIWTMIRSQKSIPGRKSGTSVPSRPPAPHPREGDRSALRLQCNALLAFSALYLHPSGCFSPWDPSANDQCDCSFLHITVHSSLGITSSPPQLCPKGEISTTKMETPGELPN